MARSLKEIVKVDDMTVKFVLNRPDATVLATFPMDFASIVSKEYADQLEAAGTKEQFNVQPVGTGPFTFVDYQQDAVIRYQANPDWWNGKQAIDDLIFAITVDAGRAPAEARRRRVRHHPLPEPRRHRGAEGATPT